MKPIRAFVGHSFTEDDAEVVGKFLKYLDQLAELHPNFSWQHAELAELKILADKVMRLLTDKNLFIGICTKKERVVLPSALKATTFSRTILKARENDFYWKTSDWIIQEIGLAKGRNLDVILLVEEGLRQPGGLQGDLEYITFDRMAPERCFGKIVEMITALSPKAAAVSSAEVESRSEPAEEKSRRELPARNEWTTPKPEWNRRDYERALMHMVIADDAEGANAISDGYLATEMGLKAANQRSWEAYVEYVRLVFGKGGQLAKVKRLSEEDPNNSEIFFYLGRAYEEYLQYSDSATAYENAARATDDTLAKLKRLGEAAVAHLRARNAAAALEIFAGMKSLAVNTPEGEAEVLRAQRKCAEIAKDDELLIGAMERLLDIDPADNDTRFALAYKHSELGNADLALLHYSTIPHLERSAGTWNNLGVAFEQLGLPAKSVVAYRKAEEMGETLAMSNLANKLAGAGFLSEAQKICDAALAVKDYHKNVGMTVGRLKELPEEEAKKGTELLEKAKPISDFFKEIGRAAARAEPANLEGRWQGPDCILDVTLSALAFVATGSYERPSLGFGALALFSSGSASGQRDGGPVRHRVEYRGKATGCAIVARVNRRREDEPARTPSLLGAGDDDPKVLMVLSDDGTELRALEVAKKSSPRFYKLTRDSLSA